MGGGEAYHFISFEERVGFGFCVAFRAVEPFLAWKVLRFIDQSDLKASVHTTGRSDRDLCIKNVFTAKN